jgi:hypothetical protein
MLPQRNLSRRLLDLASKAQILPTTLRRSPAALSVWSQIRSSSPLVAVVAPRPQEVPSFLQWPR